MATHLISAVAFPSNPPPPSLPQNRSLRCGAVGLATEGEPIPSTHPSLDVSGGGLNRFLPAFKSLHRPYNPFPIIASNGHAETIFAAYFRSFPEVKYRRECLRMDDNGTVALDWISGDNRRLPADFPVLILMHGLTGGSHDSYVKHMAVRARSRGFRVVAYNGRGGGYSPVTTPQFYSASFIGDIREVVALVAKRYPKANIYAAGWSLGGNILVNYLGTESDACPLSGAVSLCNPYDLVLADENLRKGFNIIYDKALAGGLSKNFSKHAALFEDIEGEYNISMAMNAQSVREYDEAITRLVYGFKSVDEYYSKASSANVILHVRTPLLCIQASNDPIAPIEATPRKAIEANQNCMLIVTPKGGHLGWVAGDDAPFGAPWTDPVLLEFLEYLEKNSSNSKKD